MHTVLDIDRWARQVAESEALALRDDVAALLRRGSSLSSALEIVRMRMRTLTPAQREIVIAAINPAKGTPA